MRSFIQTESVVMVRLAEIEAGCLCQHKGAPSITVQTRQYTHSETWSTSVENAQTNDQPLV